MADIRVRFDDKFDAVLEELRGTEYFADLSAIAIFAGALGFANGVTANARGNKDVRLSVLLGTPGALPLINAIALACAEESELDPLRSEGLANRAKLFEGFVNGGLGALQEIRKLGKPLAIAIPELVSSNFKNAGAI